MGTQDPFDFIDPDTTLASDNCSFSSESTVPYRNTGAGKVTSSPSIFVSEAGRVTNRIDVSMQPQLSAASQTSDYNHLHTFMINACMISCKF